MNNSFLRKMKIEREKMNDFDSGDIKAIAPILASLNSSNPNKFTCEVYKDIMKTNGEALLITLIVEKMDENTVHEAIKDAIEKEKFIEQYYELKAEKWWTGNVRIVFDPQVI